MPEIAAPTAPNAARMAARLGNASGGGNLRNVRLAVFGACRPSAAGLPGLPAGQPDVDGLLSRNTAPAGACCAVYPCLIRTRLPRFSALHAGACSLPATLRAATLQSRLQKLYLPRWLVDGDVQAEWQADAGFDYQVVSHQDRFDETKGDWQSEQLTETRVRWEPRLGRLQRHYDNVAAPAIEEDGALQKAIGDYDLQTSRILRCRRAGGRARAVAQSLGRGRLAGCPAAFSSPGGRRVPASPAGPIICGSLPGTRISSSSSGPSSCFPSTRPSTRTTRGSSTLYSSTARPARWLGGGKRRCAARGGCRSCLGWRPWPCLRPACCW